MIIDDGDSDRTRRNAIFNTVHTQAALSWQSHTLYKKSTIVMYGRVGYVTNEPYSYCAGPITFELGVPDSAAPALVSGIFFASLNSLMILLFINL